MKKKNKAGTCPECGSENLQYGVIELDGKAVFYPWTCQDCKTAGQEWYNLQFVEQVVDR